MNTDQNFTKPLSTKHIIGVFAFCIALTMGCERDFPNPNEPVEENVTVPSLVTGTEAGMRIDLAVYLRVVAIVGREAYYFEPADPRYTGELVRGVPDPGGFLVNRPWRERYHTIANCRLLLEKAASLTGAQKAGVEGFAKTIMAYQLLLNLNYMGSNGIKLDFSGDLSAPFVPESTAFSAIANMLDEANASLALAGSAFSFKLSSGFAGFDTPTEFAKFNRALKARVSVYRGRYNDALTSLAPTASFLNTGDPLTRGVYHVYGTGLGDQGNEIYESPTAPFVKFTAHLTFRSQADSGDTRVTSKVFVRTDTTTFDNLSSNLPLTIVSSSTDPLPIIRNEELILLRAEANIGLGNLATAETDINFIRNAAGLGNVTITAGNALDELLKQKRYSLFGEGHRWVDMRRYGRLSQLPNDRTGDVVPANMPIPETERP